jgi:GT2 family glycosyltransferase
MTDFTFAIVNWNTKDLLKQCLRSIATESAGFTTQILVADNGSDDGSANMVATEFPHVTLLRHERNLGFAGAHASLFPLSRGTYHVLVNSDAALTPGCLAVMDERMRSNPRIGILGPQLLGPDGAIQPSCRRFPTLANQFVEATGLGRLFPQSRALNAYRMTGFDHRSPRAVDQVMGSFFLVRAPLLSEIGYLDTRFFMYYEEVDYCLRATRAGYEVFFEPAARVRHEGGGSSQRVRVPTIRRKMRSMHYYFRKHRGARVYAPLLMICAIDGITHTARALVTGNRPLETMRAYGCGLWDVLTMKPSGEPTA